MDAVQQFEQEQVKGADRPYLRAGDIVRVETKVREGEKTRLQSFEGTVLGVRGSGPSTTFTVRRETSGFGVERIFPLFSPLITSIDIVKRQKVRRARLSYLRQAGRRRFKEDVQAMQRHLKGEADKKRLAEEAKKKEEALRQAQDKEEKAEASTSAEATEDKTADKEAEDVKAQAPTSQGAGVEEKVEGEKK